ncbi:proprotein convertase P-domain-containing protein [Coleofasciculus chthonoplastes]|jgi:subtilisin-like proprotein convertase family protein|uniref:proprotein convertase P-domain-containing protein n=1 Tax=Coleofasciculus chthonoplastes TaxID=64178 RepID=UPI0032F557F5
MSKLMNRTSTATVEAKIATSSNSSWCGGGGNIPDGVASFKDEIVVTEDIAIRNVTVTLKNLEHTWVGDLIAQLRHVETGVVVDLFRRPGQPQFSSSGYSNDLNGDYSFNDSFSHSFDSVAASHAVIPSGNYCATQTLSVFEGRSSAGTWQLIINDCSAGDSGSLESWTLNLA